MWVTMEYWGLLPRVPDLGSNATGRMAEGRRSLTHGMCLLSHSTSHVVHVHIGYHLVCSLCQTGALAEVSLLPGEERHVSPDCLVCTAEPRRGDLVEFEENLEWSRIPHCEAPAADTVSGTLESLFAREVKAAAETIN